jgi:hypothetical protein
MQLQGSLALAARFVNRILNVKGEHHETHNRISFAGRRSGGFGSCTGLAVQVDEGRLRRVLHRRLLSILFPERLRGLLQG